MKDIISDLVTVLDDQLEAHVSTIKPANVEGACVTLNREGGRYQNALLDRAGVGIYCWDSTEYQTSELARQVAEIISQLKFSDGYARVEMESMRSDPDPDTREPRWYLSYTITNY